MAGTLRIHLLGTFRLLHNDVPLTGVDTPRLQSFLAYLLLHRDAPQPRQHLSFLFWPDSTEAQARTNLRKALYHLRQVLPDADEFIHADNAVIHWQAADRFTLDVTQLERALEESEQARQAGDVAAQRAALDRAVLLYTGELLPGCYDDWVLPARERLHQRVIAALEALAELLEGQRAYEEATGHVQHLLRLDPLHEPGYRQLMRLLALQGNRAAAIRTYHTCATILQQELDVAPGAETQQLYHRLLEQDTAELKPAGGPLAAWPLVGRDAAWAQLQAAWRDLSSGQRQVVLLTGEAGIGKTRLAEEFVSWSRRQGLTTAVARCYASGQELPYGPVADWLRSAPLQQSLRTLDPVWLSQIARVVPEILVERPETPHPAAVAEPWQRQHLFEALALPFDQQPRLLLLLDDIHWADHETIAWLSYLLHRPSRAVHSPQLLLVVTARLEELPYNRRLQAFVDELRHGGQISELELGPLSDRESSRLAAGVAGRAIDPELAAALYRQTEGNPLFVVETVRAALAEGATFTRPPADGRGVRVQRPHIHLPPAVHNAVLSRLAHLSPQARALADVASTLGRRFTFDVLTPVAAGEQDLHTEDGLVRALDELWQRHIVHQRSATDYDFTHDQIRRVVYDELSPVRRRHLHQRVARALVQIHGDNLDAASGQIARHHERGGSEREAIEYYLRAAAVARRIYANEEAIGIYRHLLDSDLSAALSDGEACTIMLDLGDVWQLTGDWPAADQIYRQALVQAEAAGSQETCARCQFSLGNLVRLQGAYDDALEWLSLARAGFEAVEAKPGQTSASHGLVRTLWAIGEVYWYKGDHARALEALERQMEIARAAQDEQGMCDAAGTMGIVYWSLGQFERAREFSLQSLEIAKGIDHWWGVGRALVNLGNTYHHEGDLAPAFAAYEQAFEVCSQIGDRQCTAWALLNIGQLYHLAGQDQAALICGQLGLQSALDMGDRWAVSLALANLAEVSASLGHLGRAERLCQKSVDLARALGANYLGDCLLGLAEFYERQGKFERAWQMSAQVLQLASEPGHEPRGGAATLFSTRLLALKLRHALGHATRAIAMNDLEGLLQQCANDEQRALVRYEMWQLDPADESLRQAAVDLYTALDPARIHGDHRRRYRHVTGEEPAPVPPLPDPSQVVGQAAVPDADWLARVDEWLAAARTTP